MKASELIEYLKRRMEIDGDLDVMFYDARGVEAPVQFEVEGLSVRLEPSTMGPMHFYMLGKQNFDGKRGFQ